MYTQCPHCDTAFRVTAPDLQRASGTVACAGCSRDFNALERLSEDPPALPRQEGDAKSPLETLNELTGPHEIRIEDTGVEWRVIDDDDPVYDTDDGPGVDKAGSMDEDVERMRTPAGEPENSLTSSVRWYLDEPGRDLDAAPDESGSFNLQPRDLPSPGDDGDVQRYDDNTPLPEDFMEEFQPETPQRRAEDRIEPRSPEADEAQVDLALGEPDDWVELLDEVGQRNESESRADDNRIESLAPGPAGQPGAAGREAGSDSLAPPFEVPAEEDALADTDIRYAAEDDEAPIDDGFPSDIDTQFDLQAIELGIDLTGNRNLDSEEGHESAGGYARPAASSGPEEMTEDGVAPELSLESSEEDLATDGQPEQEHPAVAAAENPAANHAASTKPGDGGEEWFELSDAAAPSAAEDSLDAEERLREEAFERELAAAWSIPVNDVTPDGVTADDESPQAASDPVEPEHYVPPQTEEEMTINMLIDQDLIRLAEQQDVFTSTRAHNRLEDAPHVETIIMEGEFVRNALEAEPSTGNKDAGNARDGAVPGPGGNTERKSEVISRAKKTRAVDAPPDEDDILFDSYVKGRDRMRGGRRRTDPPSYRVIGGVAALALVLAAQVVHAYRDSLATYAIFDRTLGSVYRLLGEPLHPDWNIKEWQFEATSGRTDEMDEVLTISSRVANNSARSLPYPLLHVSLTDRWEEIIGSKVLEPGDYLAGSADPSARVPPGESFTASVRVEAPSPEATGFKLNVCYRDAGNRVRCATEDFKD